MGHGALEQPAPARGEWLTTAAGHDPDLLREAEALLHAHDTAAGFLEEPVAIDPADFVDSTFPPGTRIGSYIIEREIGRGGMGIVYLAEDTRLGRRVAIKSLPPVAAGAWRRRVRCRRWWEFHQAMTALTYWLMVIPAWTVRGVLGGWTGRAVFLVTLAAVSSPRTCAFTCGSRRALTPANFGGFARASHLGFRPPTGFSS